jgi:hypothetical protein
MKSILVGLIEISGSHGGEYEDERLLGYSTLKIPEGCRLQVGVGYNYKKVTVMTKFKLISQPPLGN